MLSRFGEVGIARLSSQMVGRYHYLGDSRLALILWKV
jgi:hypothetical protein